MSFNLFAKNSRVGVDPTLELWINRVLSHKEGDYRTSAHYNNFKSIEENANEVILSTLNSKVDALTSLVEGKKSIDVCKPIVLNFKEAQQKEEIEKVRVVFEAQDPKPSQTELEKLMKGTVSRALVRRFYSQSK
jgi:hypothetical protein